VESCQTLAALADSQRVKRLTSAASPYARRAASSTNAEPCTWKFLRTVKPDCGLPNRGQLVEGNDVVTGSQSLCDCPFAPA